MPRKVKKPFTARQWENAMIKRLRLMMDIYPDANFFYEPSQLNIEDEVRNTLIKIKDNVYEYYTTDGKLSYYFATDEVQYRYDI